MRGVRGDGVPLHGARALHSGEAGLAHLLREGAPAITYLDRDIRVFSSLEVLDRLAVSHGVVLTPHNTVPLPDDGERPNQIDILLAGVYNLGYVSLGASDETHGPAGLVA